MDSAVRRIGFRRNVRFTPRIVLVAWDLNGRYRESSLSETIDHRQELTLSGQKKTISVLRPGFAE
jgi:hypothetical protein